MKIKKVIPLLITLFALISMQELWSMKQISSLKERLSGSGTKKEDIPTEPKARPARSERSYENTRSTLDELGIVGRSDRSARSGSESRSARNTTGSTESAKDSRSFLQRIMGRGSSEPKKEIEISGPTGFRITTEESLARMKPEDADRIRRAQARENTKMNITSPLDNTARDADANKALLQKKESPEEIAMRAKRQEEQLAKSEQMTKDLSGITNQLNETRAKIRDEMKKNPEDRNQKLLTQLNLEKKKLGDKASSMEKTVKNIETRARFEGMNAQELSTEVARLQKQADQAKKDLTFAQAEQDLKTNRLRDARKNLSPEDKQKYADLAASHKIVEEKLADKSTPSNEVKELLAQRKAIRNDIQNISPELATRHYELADHEASFVTAKKNVQLTQAPLTIAKSALEERTTPQESEPIKTARTKKSVSLSEINEEPATKKEPLGPTAVPAKGILKKSGETESIESVAPRRRGVGFGAVETSDTLLKKEPLPADAQPSRGILKQSKSVGLSSDTESTEPSASKKGVGFSIDQKSLEEFEKKAGPPPSKLPPLPPEADKTPNLEGISPAMRKILRDEEKKFEQSKATTKTDDAPKQISSQSASSSATSDAWVQRVGDSKMKSQYGDLTPSEKQKRLDEIYKSNMSLIDKEGSK